MTKLTMIDNLVGTLMSDGNSVCDFCKRRKECDTFETATGHPICCSTFDIDKMEDAIDEIVHRED